MMWTGQQICRVHKPKYPTDEEVDALSSTEADYMAECFGLAPYNGDSKQVLKNFFNERRA